MWITLPMITYYAPLPARPFKLLWGNLQCGLPLFMGVAIERPRGVRWAKVEKCGRWGALFIDERNGM